MSIANVYYDADRVLIGVDSAVALDIEGMEHARAHGLKSGIFGRVVVAARGNVSIFHALSDTLLQMQHVDGLLTVDILEPALPALLESAHALVQQVIQARGVLEEFDVCEVTIAGWSPRLKQMRAYVATLEDGEWSVEKVRGQCLAPGVPDLVDGRVSSEQAMMDVARQQVAHFKEGTTIGGELTVYDIRQDAIIVRQMGAI